MIINKYYQIARADVAVEVELVEIQRRRVEAFRRQRGPAVMTRRADHRRAAPLAESCGAFQRAERGVTARFCLISVDRAPVTAAAREAVSTGALCVTREKAGSDEAVRSA